MKKIDAGDWGAELAPVRSLGYQVRRCHRRFDRFLNAVLSEHGLKTGYWYYLRVLWREDNLTQKQLSDLTNVTENTTAAMISGMISAGLITRSRALDDRRRMSIRLTELGRSFESKLMPYAHHINDLAAEGVSKEDMATCLKVLDKLSLNLAEAYDGYIRSEDRSLALAPPVPD